MVLGGFAALGAGCAVEASDATSGRVEHGQLACIAGGVDHRCRAVMLPGLSRMAEAKFSAFIDEFAVLAAAIENYSLVPRLRH